MVTSRFNITLFGALLSLLFLLPQAVKAQEYSLKLIKTQSLEHYYIREGHIIMYKAPGGELKRSRITSITPDGIITQEDSFTLEDINFIGYKEPLVQMYEVMARLSYYGSFVLLGLGFYAYIRLPQRPEIGTAIMITAFIPLIISKRIYKRDYYKFFDLSGQWKAEIVRTR